MASVIATCREKGAFVAEIRDQKANDAILAMRKSENKTFVISSGTDEAEEGKWVWASDGQVFHENGQPVEGVFTNWAGASAPAPKISVAENCLVMPKSGANEGKWQDRSCQGKAVACEAQVVVGIAHYLDDLDDVK